MSTECTGRRFLKRSVLKRSGKNRVLGTKASDFPGLLSLLMNNQQKSLRLRETKYISSGGERFGIVKENRRDNRVVKHCASIKHQSETIRRPV